jgi:hypothetical protein
VALGSNATGGFNPVSKRMPSRFASALIIRRPSFTLMYGSLFLRSTCETLLWLSMPALR